MYLKNDNAEKNGSADKKVYILVFANNKRKTKHTLRFGLWRKKTGLRFLTIGK